MTPEVTPEGTPNAKADALSLEVLPDAAAVASRAADLIAEAARSSVAARGRFIFAVSGGRTPWVMLERLARLDVPWTNVHIVQVDERVAPPGDDARNLTHLQASLISRVPLPPSQVHAMPVEQPDLGLASRRYAAILEGIAGNPPVIDLVHLGLGPDGHTASLVPGDPVLEVTDRAVAPVGVYQGHRRMTLTYPTLDRARRILWVITGDDKRDPLSRLLRGDPSIPAGRIARTHATVIADRST